MTVQELLDQLQSYCTRHPREAAEQQVVVETGNGGVPHRYMSPVVAATSGFDWTKGLFVIHTSDTLIVERMPDRPWCDLAEERLLSLKVAYKQLGQDYLRKKDEPSWLDGFIEGAKQQFTGEKK
jgi:hypothetical protein